MNRKFRHIALLALAAVMTVGCGSASEEDIDLPVPPQPGQETPIAFSGSLSEEGAVTRTDPTEPKGLETVLPVGNKKFRVWAYKNPTTDSKQTVMDGYTVNWVENSANTTTSNTHDWEYVNQQTGSNPEQTIKYWDFSAKAYRFFGSTLTSTGELVTEAGETLYRMTFYADAKNKENTSYYSQLWYSDNTLGRPSYGEPVKLVFLQPFSMVRFMFIFEDENDAPQTDLTDKNFEPSDGNSIKIRGLLHIYYPLTGSATTETLIVDDTAEGMSNDGKGFTQDYYEDVRYDPGSGKAIYPYFNANEYMDDEMTSALNMWYTVLPMPTGQSSYTLTVSVNGEPKTTVVPAQYMTWLPGYKYTYIFKVHVDGGVSIDSVESAFTPWVIGEEDHTVFNW